MVTHVKPMTQKITALEAKLRSQANDWTLREYELKREFKRTEKAYRQMLG
jgi:hypothetical protein